MTVRDLPTDPPETVPRGAWRFTEPGALELDGGFEPGRIYDVVYLSRDPKVVGVGLAGTRDIVSFFKYDTSEANPLPGIRYAIGWGVSQTGRFLRHFLYQGFNEDEQGRQVFDGVFDQVGGAGRGSFNHRFGQASRDAEQHLNFLYPVDMFPFTDATTTDPVTGETGGLLERTEATGTTPKLFHVLTNSEYFNRAGSLVHTDVTGSRDIDPPATSRIYFISSAPHVLGRFPPQPNPNESFRGQAPMNTLAYAPVIPRSVPGARRLGRHRRRAAAEPLSAHRQRDARAAGGRRLAERPRVPPSAAPADGAASRFRTDWDRGIVTREPPGIGAPFIQLVPAVDADGNDRAGIRMPELAVPLATHTGWNYRHPSIGAPDRLSGEIGSYFAFPRTRAEAEESGDPRRSIEERYRDRNDYLEE